MRLLHMLPDRWQRFAKEVTSFATIGVINTLVDFLVLNALLFIGPLKAKVVATVVATTLSYFMNRYWTFAARERTSVRREYVLFFALNLVGAAIQLAVLGVAKYGLGFSEDGDIVDRIALNAANAIGILIAMVFRFWSYRTFVFKAPASPEPVVTEAEAAAVEEALTGPVATVVATPADVTQRTPRQPLRTEALTDDEFAELTNQLDVDLDGLAAEPPVR